MKVISVINHKGGVGKSTIATQVAGCFANKGFKVVLGDFDIQQSSNNWLALRPENAAVIHSWELNDGKLGSLSSDIDYVIIDTPAGIRENALEKITAISDKIITPLKPSIFDILSTETFLEEIVEMINQQDKVTDLCVIGSMSDPRTKSAEKLQAFIEALGLESPTSIRPAQIYTHLAAHGLTIFDGSNAIFERDIEQWLPLINWIDKE